MDFDLHVKLIVYNFFAETGTRPSIEIQDWVFDAISRRQEGYLPVGASIVVKKGNPKIQYLVVSPTILAPEPVPPANSFFAMSAALRAASSSAGLFPIGYFKVANPLDFLGLTFRTDGTYSIWFDDPSTTHSRNTMEPSTYVVTGDKIVLNETGQGDGGATNCIGFPGTYTWTFDGTVLTFVQVDDQCPQPRNENMAYAGKRHWYCSRDVQRPRWVRPRRRVIERSSNFRFYCSSSKRRDGTTLDNACSALRSCSGSPNTI